MTLPPVETPEAFRALARDEPAYAEAAAIVAARHGRRGALVARCPGGSVPVFFVGDDRVVKFFPPCFADEGELEAAVLGATADRLPVPTPRVDAVGEVDGWPYLLLERLRGRLLSDVWSELALPARRALAAPLGELVAALHAIPFDPARIPGTPFDAFLAAQRADAVARQRRTGLAEAWVARIPGFLEATDLASGRAPGLLHTELMREHLFVEPRGGGWALTGLFDFEPARVGEPEYDFASFGVFVSGGDPVFLRTALRAYGYRDADLGPALARRCLVHAILHRYSRLSWYLERVPPPAGTATLEALAEAWFGTEGAA